MKNLFIVVGIILSPWMAYAQKFMLFGCDEMSQKSIMHARMPSDSVAIDTTMLTATYRFETMRLQQPIFATIRLQMGRHLFQQTDLRQYYSGLHNYYFAQHLERTDLDSMRRANDDLGSVSNLFSEIYDDFEQDDMTVICHDYFTSKRSNMYREKRPQIHWQLLTRDSIVCGYRCLAAEADFRGRKWIAWYAPEIPISSGPWKLQGLPGLILCAGTPGFRFECEELSSEQRLMYRYLFDRIQDFKTRERYMRYERSCFEHPYETFAQGETAIVLVKTPDGNTKQLDDSWTIPYDPIERE